MYRGIVTRKDLAFRTVSFSLESREKKRQFFPPLFSWLSGNEWDIDF